MGIWSEVGLEPFSYYLYDCEEVIVEQLEYHTVHACRWVGGLPADDPFECVFVGEDIAFKNGPMVRVKWLEKHYFPRLARVISSLHAKGKKVMFHSDGNLNAIMDGLVEAGIDALNPIEITAGMDLGDLHRRCPRLVFAGGIDVSHLLPFGTPQQVRDAVVKAIEDTEGQILVGSSTEVFNIVPLENYLAMRETAMGYRF
jgi:uroporphyrinogen decarboxylase